MHGTVEEYVGRWTIVFTCIEAFFYMIAIPVWFYWSITIWWDWDSNVCYKGWITLDFVNILILYAYTCCFAIAAAFLVPCAICCAPAIIG